MYFCSLVPVFVALTNVTTERGRWGKAYCSIRLSPCWFCCYFLIYLKVPQAATPAPGVNVCAYVCRMLFLSRLHSPTVCLDDGVYMYVREHLRS